MSHDAVIIGSGFGGSIAADRLTAAGLDVLVLERGPWRDSLPVRAIGFAERSPFPYGARFATHAVRGVHIGRGARRGRRRPFAARVTINPRGLFELFSYPGIDVLCASGVGGGSLAWLGVLTEPSQAYWQDRHPDLNPAEIERYYDKIRTDLGATRLTRRHAVPNSVWDQLPDTGGARCQAAEQQPELAMLLPGTEADVGRLLADPGMPARRFAAFDGDGVQGSRTGAKASVDFIYLQPAREHGATVRDLCEVTRIARETTRTGDGYAIHYGDLRTGQTSIARTTKVILAAGTLNTLRLLFSAQARHDLQAMPSLGRTVGGNGDFFGVWERPAAEPPTFNAPPVLGRFLLDGADSPFTIMAGTAGLDTLPLPSALRRRLGQLVIVGGMGADSGTASAHFHRGRIEIDYDAAAEPVFEQLREAFGALQADSGHRVSAWPKPATVHAWGGARVGADAEAGVVDHTGEVYGNPGIYVADASALPAAAGVPPSLTIAAWAHHVADGLAERTARPAPSAQHTHMIEISS